MRQKIERGRTLLVNGPACVIVRSGSLRAFGASVKVGEHVVVRIGKQIPFEAQEDSEVEVLLGNQAACEMIDEESIPLSWKEAAGIILSSKGKVEVAILGAIDSGKSSFSIYLANMALSCGRRVALVDGDLGQSDIGPPGTLGLSMVRKAVIDPSNLQPDHIVFIGVTSPQSVIDQTINGLISLRDRALNAGADFIVINTDGWVEGMDAVNYKCQLIEGLKPSFAVIVYDRDSPKPPLVDFLAKTGVNVLLIETPKNVRKRDRETRKIIRETLYKKYLRGAKVRSVTLSWVGVDGNLAIRGRFSQDLKGKIEEIIGDKAAYCEALENHVVLVLKRGSTLSDEERNKISMSLNRPVKVLYEGDERGLLVSLEDNDGTFLGIGTIYSIDYERGILKLYTNVDREFSRVRVGRIRLDEKGNEVEIVSRSA